MALLPLEERVALLESEVTQLKRVLNQGAAVRPPWWEQIAGTFANDPAFDEAMRLGREYRERQGAPAAGAQGDDVPA